MECNRALLQFVLISFLVLKADAEYSLTVYSNPNIVYTGELITDRILKITKVMDNGDLQENIKPYISVLTGYEGQPINVNNHLMTLHKVYDDFVVTYGRPVEFRTKLSGKIYNGVNREKFGLIIYREVNSNGDTVETNCNKIAADLNIPNSIIYLTIEKEVHVIERVSIQTDKRVFVELRSKIVCTSLFLKNDSTSFYLGIDMGPGVIEVTHLVNPKGENVGATFQEVANNLIKNIPNQIVVGQQRLVRQIDMVTDAWDKGFTVRHSVICIMVNLIPNLPPWFRHEQNFYYWVIRIYKKYDKLVFENFAEIKQDLVDAKESKAEIFLKEGQAVQKITIAKFRDGENGEFIEVQYSDLL